MIVDLASPINWKSPLNDGLVSWWLNVPGASGPDVLLDLAGDLHASATNYTANQETFGYFSAQVFDGTNDAHTMGGDTTKLNLGAKTVSAWIKTTSTETYGDIVNNIGSGYNGWGLAFSATTAGRPAFYNLGAGFYYQATSGSCNDGQWHLLTVTMDTSHVVRFFLDGFYINSQTLSATAYNVTSCYIGGYLGSSRWSAFTLGDIRVWGRELDAAEVANLFDASHPDNPTQYKYELNWLDRPFVLSAPAAAFAVSGSITGDAGTISGSLGFSPPVFDLTGSITGDAGTISGALAFVPPVFALSGAITGDAGSITGSLAFAPPVFALTGAITGDAGSIAGQLEFSIPEIIVSGTITGDAGSIAGQLEFVVGTITLSGTITGDAGSIAGQLEFIATRTLSGSITGLAGTIAGALSFTIPPEYLAGPGSAGIGPYGSKLRNPLTKMFKT